MPMSPWPIKPLLTIATFCVVIAAPQFIPQLYNWRIFEWSTVTAVLDFQPRQRSAAPMEDEMSRLRPETKAGSEQTERIHDPARTMDRFYSALLRAEQGRRGEVARVLHYGDSPTTADLITADLRASLQQKFGNAGHGTYLIAKPWAWYGHRGLDVVSEGWTIHPATLRGEKDGIYGLAGVSFSGGKGAWSRVTLKNQGHDRVVVSYFAQPGGGRAALLADGEEIGTLETNAETAATAEDVFGMPATARKLEIRVIDGSVRLFHFTLFRGGPGVVYDSLGLNGVSALAFVNHINQQHWAEELSQAEPDLVVVNLGTNESGFAKYVDTTYEGDVRRMVRRIRAAVPNTPLLLMSPMDRGVREAGGRIGTIPALPRLVAIQARTAAEEGCAFFNTFEAMGGPGTMGKWYMAEPRLVSADFIHPLPTGGRIVASLVYQALMKDYHLYKLKVLRGQLAEARK